MRVSCATMTVDSRARSKVRKLAALRMVVLVGGADDEGFAQGFRHLLEDVVAVCITRLALTQGAGLIAASAFRHDFRHGHKGRRGGWAGFRRGARTDAQAECRHPAHAFILIVEERGQFRFRHGLKIKQGQQGRAAHSAPPVRQQGPELFHTRKIAQRVPGGVLGNAILLCRRVGCERRQPGLMHGLYGSEAHARFRGLQRGRDYASERGGFPPAEDPESLEPGIQRR